MSVAQTTRSSPPIGAILVLVVAVFLYAGMMANVDQLQNHDTDAMGRGLASAFGMLFAVAEWVVLAILMLIGGVKGEMPAGSAITAAIVLPLSGVSAMMAMSFLDHGASPLYQLVPGLLPPLLAFYALWARLPALHRLLPPVPTSLAAWGAIALLTVAPLPHYLAH